MRSLAGEMAAAGDHAVFIGIKRDSSGPSRGELRGLPVYYLGRPGSWLHAPLAAAQMAAIFRKEGVDVAHFHMAGPDYFGFWLVALFRRVPFVLTFHSFDARRLRACGAFYPAILRFLLGRARALTAVSRSVASLLEAFHPEVAGKVRVVANGVDRIEERAAGAAGPRVPFILYAGPLCHEKGTDLLLLAFRDMLSGGGRPLRLALCGEDLTGGLFADLTARLGLRSSVDYWGPCSHERVLELMRDCLFYVCPSREESFGIAILEAMASGKTVVAPRTGGVPDYIQDGANGLLFRGADPAGLRAAMERIVADPGLRRALQSRARSTATAFTWGKARQEYRDAYRLALATV